MKYFNEYYYGLDLIAFINMNHPNPWYINRDINFYHKDALGSITAITDRYENVVERYRYDAYGNPYEGRFLHMPKNNSYGFTGQRFEPELRMYSFAYRTYNPMSMRWMTVDPVRDGTNWYLYVSGDPVNLWDPLGLCEVDPTNWWNIMKVTDPMMRGSDVEELQYCLNQLGYNISVDGYYGNETANAVKQYQVSKGLAADGIVGPNTRDEIMKDLGIEIENTNVISCYNEDDIRDRIAKNAKALAGSKYVLGEERLGATDCSGTVFYSYNEAGVEVPRLTAQGYHNIMKKIKKEDIQPGDIITYSNINQNNRVTHVQVYIGTAEDRKGITVNDAVINAGSTATGVYIVSLEEYLSWSATSHLIPHYGTLLP